MSLSYQRRGDQAGPRGVVLVVIGSRRSARETSDLLMRLEGIHTGDIVEVDHHGRRFHALVTGTAPGGLALQPFDRRVNFYNARSREVIGHWAKRGRPNATSQPLKPSPRQLEIDLSGS